MPNERIVLARNDAYWGPREPHWSRVVFRLVDQPAVRSAALLAGDADAIDNVAAQDMERLRGTAGIGLWSAPRTVVIYLADGQLPRVDAEHPRRRGQAARRQPAARPPRAPRPQPLDRARRAGRAHPRDRAFPPAGSSARFFGHLAALNAAAPRFASRAACSPQAGWPNGFQLTLHGSNDRYLNDVKLTQAVGQMFARLGIAGERRDAAPGDLRHARQRLRVQRGALRLGQRHRRGRLVAQGAGAHARHAIGGGASNRGRYSNPALDALIDRSLAAFDDAEREKLMIEATRLAMEDVAIIPLYFQVNTWATRGPIAFTPRADEVTPARLRRDQMNDDAAGSPGRARDYPAASRWKTSTFPRRPIISETTRAAVDAVVAGQLTGDATREDWAPIASRVRANFAALIGARPDEIALTKNVSDGLNAIAKTRSTGASATRSPCRPRSSIPTTSCRGCWS